MSVSIPLYRDKNDKSVEGYLVESQYNILYLVWYFDPKEDNTEAELIHEKIENINDVEVSFDNGTNWQDMVK